MCQERECQGDVGEPEGKGALTLPPGEADNKGKEQGAFGLGRCVKAKMAPQTRSTENPPRDVMARGGRAGMAPKSCRAGCAI